MTTGVVILARMKSERFPGKVVAQLGGRPILAHLIDKARHVGPDKIVVATSTEPEDDAIVDLCDREGALCFRGPDRDILTRILGAWRHHGLTHAVEFSGDCPFIDIDSAMRVRDALVKHPDFDQYEPTCYPHGILGIMCAGRGRTYWEKLAEIVHRFPEEERGRYIESPWILGTMVVPSPFSVYAVDTGDLHDPRVTPINLCVDYPLQLAILNRIVGRMGFVPHSYKTMEKAFRTWRDL